MATLDAVHDVDIGSFVDKLRADGMTMVGRCAICGEDLDPVKAAAFRRNGAAVELACDQPACLAALLQ